MRISGAREKMADVAESVEVGVKRLCKCLLHQAFRLSYEGDVLLSGLQPPSKSTPWNELKREKVIRRLSQVTFDLLLLRKWAWFGSWSHTPLSPLCWCRAYSYGHHTRGREKEGKRLNSALDIFTSDNCSVLLEKEAILQFLVLLAGDMTTQPLKMNTSVDSGVFCYDTIPSSVFEQVPGSTQLSTISHAIDHTSALFSSVPGSGFRGFLSSGDLMADKTPVPSSLFDGLSHSTTPSLNSHLSLPNLPSHPNLISLLPSPPSTSTLPADVVHSPPPSPPPSPSLPWNELCSESVSLRSWEGWLHHRPFLSEAGPEALRHSLFLSHSHLPLPAEEPHPPTEAETPPSGRGLEKGSVGQAFESAVTRLQQYWQTLTDRLHNVPPMQRTVGEHDLFPLLSLLSSVQSTSTAGLEIVDSLFCQCCTVQGTPHYSLLLSLLSLCLTPYTHFLSQWLFCGYLDEKEEFGIHSNHRALQCRDHHYWTDGYTATESCTPTFLSRHSHTVLACGKALNFLRLVHPQHPLCGQGVKCPPVAVATSIEMLEELTRQCQAYLDSILEKVSEDKRRRQQKAEVEEQEAMEVVLQARKKAREAILAAREREADLERQRLRETQEWLLELKTRASEARLLKMEREREEKKRDKEMVAVLVGRDEALTMHEKKLAEKARVELVAHYEALGREAEQRKQRAEWREARWRLASQRREWLENEHWESRETNDVGGGVEERETNGLGGGVEGEVELIGDGVVKDVEESKVTENEVSGAPLAFDVAAGLSTVAVDEPHVSPSPATPQPLAEDKHHHNEQGSTHTPIVPVVTRAQAPPSTIGDLIHHDGGVANHQPITQLWLPSTQQHALSSRGQAPPTTIQNLLYPLNSDKSSPTEPAEATPTIGEFPCAPSQSYILSYPQLDEAPSSDILTPIIGPSLARRGMDADIMLFPLPSLLDCTLSLPLLTQNYLVNSALLDHFLTSCHVTTHFLSLKRFLLLEDGEFAYSISSQLFHKLESGGGASMTSPTFLNPLLQSALDSSLHGNSPNAELLTFAVGSLPPSHPHAVDALDFLQLRYMVEWPCNVVITEDSLRKYNRAFHLLLQLRRASWTLKNVFTLVQQCKGLDKQQKRQLQIHRHEFQHFVGVMEGYITNQLFYLSWRELEEDMATKVHSLDDLIRAHQTFIDKAIFRCLLSKKATAVMKIIQTIFSCILQFYTTLSSSSLPSPLHLFHSLSCTHRKFRETAGLLIKVIMKLVERGYQPHLEDFLLRLNFNHFYG